MSEEQPGLAPLVSAMAAELRAMASDRARERGPSAALQAMILTLLARILFQLEVMILAWQAGLLKPPAPRAPRPRQAAPAPRPTAPRTQAPSWPRETTRARPEAPAGTPSPIEPPLLSGAPGSPFHFLLVPCAAKRLQGRAMVSSWRPACGVQGFPAPILQKSRNSVGPAHAHFITNSI